MTYKEFYGEDYEKLELAKKQLEDMADTFQKANLKEHGETSIAYCKSRIKTPESMSEKLKKRKLPVCADAALHQVNDAVGIRIVCSFFDDIYKIANWIQSQEWIQVIKTKDYIAYPKKNGYRSYHMIVFLSEIHVTAEIQIRTIALDFWASLEHQMKYKHHIQNEELIRSELKRCADEIASVDLSMQTIKDLIQLKS